MIAGDLEDAGDDIDNEFGRHILGRRTFQGGSFLVALVQAMIRCIGHWSQIKERVVTTNIRVERWINAFLGNVRRTISDSYQAGRQAQYARSHLAEAAYLLNLLFRLTQLKPRLVAPS